MTKELAKKESTEVSTHLADWGEPEAVSMNDVVIPKILAMQPMSDFVADGKAAFGDLVESSTAKKLGSIEKPVEFIPFHLERIWIVSEVSGLGEKKFVRIDKAGVDSKELEWEFTENGKKYQRDYTYNFFVLLVNDLKALPHVVSFKRTSTPAAKQLYTQMFVQNRQAGLSPAGTVMVLGGKKIKNEKNQNYVVLSVSAGRKTTKAEEEAAFEWKKTFAKTAAVVDHGDLTQNHAARAEYVVPREYGEIDI